MPAMLELVRPHPDWLNALGVALTRPPGVPERRREQEPGEWPAPADRPRRVSHGLAGLRQAMDEPAAHGLQTLGGTAAVGAWEAAEDAETIPRLLRLRDRGVLDAAGFLLHEPDTTPIDG